MGACDDSVSGQTVRDDLTQLTPPCSHNPTHWHQIPSMLSWVLFNFSFLCLSRSHRHIKCPSPLPLLQQMANPGKPLWKQLPRPENRAAFVGPRKDKRNGGVGNSHVSHTLTDDNHSAASSSSRNAGLSQKETIEPTCSSFTLPLSQFGPQS